MNTLTNCLYNQGYTKPLLTTHTTTALERYTQQTPLLPQEKAINPKKFYYQLEYHRRGVPREFIQQQYNSFIAPHLPHQLTVVFNRPTNLKDLLCKSKLPNIPGKNPSDILKQLQKQKQKQKNR